MNVLKPEKQLAIVSALVEGNSIRSTERMTGVHRDTIMRLTNRVGEGCQKLLAVRMRDLPCKRLQVDEVWCYVRMKQRRVRDLAKVEIGDQYVFVAVDAETKLVPITLQSATDRGGHPGRHHWQPRLRTYLHVVRRAPEPHPSDADPAPH